MKNRVTRIVECILACTGVLFLGSVLQSAVAQDSANLPYMNPQLSPEQRATDLVRRMTLAEKASEMQNNSAAVPRLNIPAYQWWSEALHGVINEGVTEYPEPIGLAATFDAPGIHTMAAQIGIEGRIKHVQNAARRTHRHHGRPGFLVAQSEHLSRPALGPRTGDLRRRSVPHRPHGRCLRDRIAGRRPQILPGHRDAEALRRAQRTGTDPPLCRCGREQARRGGHLRARIPRRHRGRQGRIDHVRVQRDQWPAGVRQPVPAAGPVARQVGFPGVCGLGLRRGAGTLPPTIAIVQPRRRAWPSP